MLIVPATYATDYYWTNSAASANFTNSTAWNPAVVPTSADTVHFTNAASYTVNWTASTNTTTALFDATSGTVTAAVGAADTWAVNTSLIIGQDPSAVASLWLSTGTLAVTNSAGTAVLNIGPAGTGLFTLNGGTLTVNSLLLTNVTGTGVGTSFLRLNTGTLTTYGATILMATNGFGDGVADFRVGGTNSGAGNITWNISGGTNTITTFAKPNGLYSQENGNNVIIGGPSNGKVATVNVTGSNTVFQVNGGALSIGSQQQDPGAGGVAGSSNGNQLNITGGAKVYNTNTTTVMYIGWGAAGNSLNVSGSNSLFSSVGISLSKSSSSANSITVSNQGQILFAATGVLSIGENTSGIGNILVTDTNSLISVGQLSIAGHDSSVIISNGATLRTINASGMISGDHNTAGSNNKLIITGAGSLLTNSFDVTLWVKREPGSYQSNFLFRVENQGAAYMRNLTIGGYHTDNPGGSNSVQVAVVVTDTNSVLRASGTLNVSKYASDPTVNLVVSNGASLFSATANIGYYNSGTNKVDMAGSAVVTGSGSVWTNSGDILLGVVAGVGTRTRGDLTVNAGGAVVSANGRIGSSAGATGSVTVADSTSRWTITNALSVGESGNGTLIITNGALVSVGATANIGLNATSADNQLSVFGSTLTVTNATASGVLDVRRGNLTLDGGGLIRTDKLLVTNTAGTVSFNAGVLYSQSTTVNDGQDFIVGQTGASTLNLFTGTQTFSNNLVARQGTINFQSGVLNAAGLIIESGGSFSFGVGTATLGSSAFSNGQDVVVGGTAGTATLNLQTGQHMLSGNLLVGTAANATGAVNITSGTLTMNTSGAGILDVGRAGVGTFTLSGGTLIANRLLLTNVTGTGVGSSFVYLNTGTLTTYGATILMATNGFSDGAADFRVGGTNSGVGNITWNISGGTNTITTFAKSNGTYSQENGNNVIIGGIAKVATVNVAGSNTIFQVNGGALSIGSQQQDTGPAGSSNGNQLNITGGAKVYNTNTTTAMYIGWLAASNVVTVSGPNSLLQANAIQVGKNNNTGGNALIISNGASAVFALAIGIEDGDTPPAGAGAKVIVTGPGSSLFASGAAVGNNGLNAELLIANGGTASFTGNVQLGNGGNGSNDLLIVTGPGSSLNVNTGIYIEGLDNGLIVSNQAAAVIGSLAESAGATNLFVIVTGTNSVATLGSVALAGGSMTATNGGKLVANYGWGLGSGVGTAQVVVAGSGSVWTNTGATSYLRLGTVAGGVGQILVNNGGQFLDTDTGWGFQLGYVAGGTGAVVVADQNSLLRYNGNIAVGVGSAGVGSLVVSNQGTFWANGSGGIQVGTAATAAGSTILVQNRGVLDFGTGGLTVGNYAGNSVTNRGSVFQFATAAPAIANGSFGKIVATNATIAFRNINNANVQGSLSGTLTNILFQGANTFQLNSASNTSAAANSQNYTFTTTGAAANYARLEMINGATAYGQGNITIGSGGSMLVSSTTATISGLITNSGSMSVIGAAATFQNRVYNTGTNTMLNSVGTFNGGVINAGSWITDPTTNTYSGFGFTNTISGIINMSAGDVYVFTNTGGTAANFINISTNKTASDLLSGKLLFSGGLGLTQNFTVAGLDLGPSISPTIPTATNTVPGLSPMAGFSNNFAIGTLEISNFSTVRVSDAFLGLAGLGADDGKMAGLYINDLIMGANSLLIIDTNVQVYFAGSNGNWTVAQNVSLIDNAGFDNTISGIHLVIPEPSVLLLLLTGLGTLIAGRRRQRRQ